MAINRKTGQKIEPYRLNGVDAAVAIEILQSAEYLLVPDDQRQREAFIPLMPHLYVLRRKGCSWEQLTKLLTQSGFKLQPSTVRTYYGEELALRQELCEARLAESILAIAEAKKAAIGMEMAVITARVKATAAQVKAAAAMKMNAIFSSGGAGAPRPLAAPLDPVPAVQEVVVAPPAENRKTGLRPDPKTKIQLAEELKTDDAANSEPQHPTGATLEDEPIPPVVKKKTAVMPPIEQQNALPPQLVCQKLQDGVKEVEKRDTVAAEIYQPGNFEHPAIPGLVLNLAQRLYGAALEYTDANDGVIKIESVKEKVFRLKWTKPIPMTISSTSGNFTKMNNSLFKKT